jgi:hypothetical protein
MLEDGKFPESTGFVSSVHGDVDVELACCIFHATDFREAVSPAIPLKRATPFTVLTTLPGAAAVETSAKGFGLCEPATAGALDCTETVGGVVSTLNWIVRGTELFTAALFNPVKATVC